MPECSRHWLDRWGFWLLRVQRNTAIIICVLSKPVQWGKCRTEEWETQPFLPIMYVCVFVCVHACMNVWVHAYIPVCVSHFAFLIGQGEPHIQPITIRLKAFLSLLHSCQLPSLCCIMRSTVFLKYHLYMSGKYTKRKEPSRIFQMMPSRQSPTSPGILVDYWNSGDKWEKKILPAWPLGHQ